MDRSLCVLVASDVAEEIAGLAERVGSAGFETSTADRSDTVIRQLRDGPAPDLVLLDLSIEGTGIELLDRLQLEFPDVPVIAVVDDPSPTAIVEAMHKGAYDVIARPLSDAALEVSLRRSSERVRLQQRVEDLSEQLGEATRGGYGIVAESPGMRRAMRLLGNALESSATVLLLGESGTGKGVLASVLHRRGPRAGGPFVAVNCAAIPEHLLESELFGHEKGAFTGADAARVGKFEAANGGVLFLDEIGDMPLPLQAKLLRVLQERTVVRVGSNQPVSLDVRVIAATHADLEERVAKKEFREDLYYRLAVLEIRVPPLRDRIPDIEPLARQILWRVARSERRRIPKMSEGFLRALREFDYPGNVRQLENVLTRAVVMCDEDTLAVDHLPEAFRKRLNRIRHAQATGAGGPADSADLLEVPDLPAMPTIASEDDIPNLAEFELALMRRAVDVCGGNVSRAARHLGVSRATLYRRLYADGKNKDDDD